MQAFIPGESPPLVKTAIFAIFLFLLICKIVLFFRSGKLFTNFSRRKALFFKAVALLKPASLLPLFIISNKKINIYCFSPKNAKVKAFSHNVPENCGLFFTVFAKE